MTLGRSCSKAHEAFFRSNWLAIHSLINAWRVMPRRFDS